MGMEKVVHFPSAVPEWSVLRTGIIQAGLQCLVRMIDGLPAFPDEEPAGEWSEVRVSTGAGMTTLRRQENSILCIIWGNADEALREEWTRLAEALAGIGNRESGIGEEKDKSR